jgi:hypothetical protein
MFSNASPVTPGEDRIRLLFRMRARRLFWRMMSRQGIDPTGHWWHGVERMISRAIDNCAACKEIECCQAWLDAPEPTRGTPAFCPNGRAMEAARIMDPRSAALAGDADPNSRAEPGLGELMTDTVVKLMMKADGVNGETLRRAMTDTPRFTAAFAAPQRRLRLRPR